MSKNLKVLQIVALTIGMAGFSANAVPGYARQSDPQAQPDNTKNNKGDNQKGAVTADQQKETAADREMAKKDSQIHRQRLIAFDYAHNIKVIVRDGMVTLKGPVNTDAEKTAIGAKASDIAGADKVQNELTVKS